MLDIVALKNVLAGKNQSEIASKLGMSQSCFSNKVNNRRLFRIEEALKLAEVLNLNVDDMRKLWKGDK